MEHIPVNSQNSYNTSPITLWQLFLLYENHNLLAYWTKVNSSLEVVQRCFQKRLGQSPVLINSFMTEVPII